MNQFNSNEQQNTWQQQYAQQYAAQQQYQVSLDQRVSKVMKGVYFKMFLGLIATALTSFFVAFFKTDFAHLIATNSWVYWGFGIAEIGLVLYISARIDKLSTTAATALFYAFAVLNGMTLSLIFLLYSIISIIKTFIICAGVFGAMSVYGYFTNRDLTKVGSFLIMALFGLIIASIVNIFWGNSTLDWIVSGAGVLIFIGLTAWDTQTIKRMAENNYLPEGNVSTIGALSLYLDFINLFLYLLRFFGGRR